MTDPAILPRGAARAIKRGCAAFVLTLATFGGIGAGTAQDIAGFDSNAPVDFGADRIELQDRQDRVVLSGDVEVRQADLALDAGRMTMAYTDAGTLQIQRIDATGGVTVARRNEVARGNVAIYDFNRRVITMAGNVRLQRGSDTLNGGRLVIDLDSGISSIDGSAAGGSPAAGATTGAGDVGAPRGSGGRVTGSFSVPKN